MKKWEYMIMNCNSSLEVMHVDGVYIEEIEADNVGFFGGRGKRQPFLHEYLPNLGKQGWEVCGTSPHSTGIDGNIITVHIILKRPLEE